jgi:hypothetical protein
MKAKIQFFHCDGHQKLFAKEIAEIEAAVDCIKWAKIFKHDAACQHQAAYNKALAYSFSQRGWQLQPLLRRTPKLIGDFSKGAVFVEVQFGNSSTLYRDFYKFQYGLAHGLLSLAVLMVPMKASMFFPTRPASVRNMAEFTLARSYFTVLPINVPTMLIGLEP